MSINGIYIQDKIDVEWKRHFHCRQKQMVLVQLQ